MEVLVARLAALVGAIGRPAAVLRGGGRSRR